jgi:hypothetical protein
LFSFLLDVYAADIFALNAQIIHDMMNLNSVARANPKMTAEQGDLMSL